MASGTFICVDVSGNICVDATPEICIGEVDCNACDPAMSWRYTVILSGLDGDFAGANGSWDLVWDSGCSWVDNDPSAAYVVFLQEDGLGNWTVGVYIDPATCVIIFEQDTDGGDCDPTGSYSVSVSECSGCTDTDSCTDSAAAVATVSE